MSKSNLKIYLDSLKRHKQNDELENTTAIGDLNARRHALIQNNLRLVATIALEMHNAWQRYDVMDFIQEGNVALMRIVDAYKPGKAQFSTFLSFYVRGAIINFIKANAGPVKVGTTNSQRRIFKHYSKIKSELETDGDSLGCVARKYDVDMDDIQLILNLNHVETTDFLVTDDLESDFIARDFECKLKERIDCFVDTLDCIDKVIFEENMYEGTKTLAEIGEFFNVTRQAIHKRKEAILESARDYFEPSDLMEMGE